jgi:hypothetical protein
MAEITKHPFQPGVVVAIIGQSYSAPRPVRRVVEKVHKTGRFVLVDSPRDQWSPRSDGTAVAAGAGYWSRPTCEVWTEKHDKMLAVVARRDRYRAAMEYLRTARVEAPGEEVVAAAEALAALAKAELEREG